MDYINYASNIDWLNNAIDMNTKGVTLCGQGHEAMALEYFKGALEVLSWASMKSDNVGQLVNPSACQLGQRQYQLENSCKYDSKGHFVYEKALLFSASKNSEATDPHRIAFYIAVLEFNIALCLQTLSRNLAGDRNLVNSLHVYDCCLEHICRSKCDDLSDFEDSWHLLLIAALNNKAAILAELNRLELAREVLVSLMKALRCYGGLEEGSINEDDLEGFLFNVMLLKGICTAPAA